MNRLLWHLQYPALADWLVTLVLLPVHLVTLYATLAMAIGQALLPRRRVAKSPQPKNILVTGARYPSPVHLSTYPLTHLSAKLTSPTTHPSPRSNSAGIGQALAVSYAAPGVFLALAGRNRGGCCADVWLPT